MDLPPGPLSLSPQRRPSSWSAPFLLTNCLCAAMVFLSLPQTAGPETSRNQMVSLSWAEGSSEVTYTHTHAHARAHVCVHAYTRVCMQVCTLACVCTCAHPHMPLHTCTRMIHARTHAPRHYSRAQPHPLHIAQLLSLPEAQDRHQHRRIFCSPRTP